MTRWLYVLAAAFAIALVSGCGGSDTDTAKSGGKTYGPDLIDTFN